MKERTRALIQRERENIRSSSLYNVHYRARALAVIQPATLLKCVYIQINYTAGETTDVFNTEYERHQLTKGKRER